MPEYVRNFSEGLIDEKRYICMHRILACWFESLSYTQYVAKNNIHHHSSESRELTDADLERYDKNFNAFMERVASD